MTILFVLVLFLTEIYFINIIPNGTNITITPKFKKFLVIYCLILFGWWVFLDVIEYKIASLESTIIVNSGISKK